MMRIVFVLFLLSLAAKLYWFGSLPSSLAIELTAAQRMLLGERPFSDFYFDDSPLSIIVRLPVCLLTRLFFFAPPPANLNMAQMVVSLLAYFASLLFSTAIYIRARRGSFDKTTFLTVLSGYILGETALVYLNGSLQHLLCLALSPYLTTVFLRLYGGESRRRDTISSALLAAFALSLSFHFLPIGVLLLVLEASLSGSFKRTFISARAGLLLFLPPLILAASALCFDYNELFDWILPLRHSQYLIEPSALYGFGRSPDLRTFVYCFCAIAVTALGLTGGRRLFYPALALSFVGFSMYLFSIYGLSEELVLCLWSSAVMLAFLAAGLAKLIYVKSGAAYGLPSRASKLRLLGLASVSALSLFLASGVWLQYDPKLLQSPEFAGNLPELRDHLRENRAKPVLFLSGKPSPGPALVLAVGRQPAGYFISSEALGSVANLKVRHCDGRWLNREKDWLLDLEKVLLQRLHDDIARTERLSVFIEGGEMHDLIEQGAVKDLLVEMQPIQPNCRYYAIPSGPSEYADRNYDFSQYEK